MKCPLRLVAAGSLLGLALISCEQPTRPLNQPAFDASAASALEFIPDRATFNSRFPGLPVETFEEGTLPPNKNVTTCPGPLDATTNNPPCFQAGDIKPGVQFNEELPPLIVGQELALDGPGFFAATSKNIAAGDFGHAFIITFTAGTVTATGMDLVAFIDADVCHIDVFGANGLLGSTTASCTNAGAFWGVSSSEPITQIRILASKAFQTEGVDNISFGGGVQQGTKSGVKFNDLNGNGVQDMGEPGLAGWEIRAYTDDGDGTLSAIEAGATPAAITMTASSGAYTLTLNPGSYVVCEVLQATWTESMPANTKCAANTTLGPGGYAVTVTSGSTGTGNDFGNFQQGTKSGVKFNDLNGNGVQDMGEPGLAGWEIRAYTDDGNGTLSAIEAGATPAASTMTAGSGSYTLTLHPGSYVVCEVLQPTWTESTPTNTKCAANTTLGPGGYAVTVTSGSTETGNKFGNFQRLPPTAKAGGPYSGTEGTAISFDGSASGTNPPGGQLSSYAWDFGDGTPVVTATAPTAQHTYADNRPDNAAYVVTLTVTAANGLTNTATTTATIANVAPTVGTITAPADPVEVGTSVAATAGFTDPGTLDTHTGTFDWGDGTTSSADVTETNGSGSASGHHSYAAAGVYTVTLSVTDKDGGVGRSVFESIHVFQLFPPVAQAGGPYSGIEGTAVTFDASGSATVPPGGALHYAWDFGDGTSLTVTTPTVQHTYADNLPGNAPYTVRLTVTAPNGLSSTANTTAMISNVAPTVGTIIAPVDPVEVGTSVVATASFTDPGTLDSHTGLFDWGDGTTSNADVSGTNSSGSASGSHAYAAAGVYTLTLTVTDKDGGVGQSVFQFVVVFNPVGGFVTGGGWIISPPGAYPAGPSLSGKATFGFVSKYPKNAITPIGSTEFDFHIGALRFRSTSYDWLVVSTSKVRFKGSGTINGAGDFAFQVTAVDGDLIGGPDTFRMTIWDKSTGFVIYDNEMGTGNGAPAITPLGGGSIVIHP